ncbi:MAG: hypothetical protein ABW022_00055 [Actinoplanes sp.]
MDATLTYRPGAMDPFGGKAPAPYYAVTVGNYTVKNATFPGTAS